MTWRTDVQQLKSAYPGHELGVVDWVIWGSALAVFFLFPTYLSLATNTRVDTGSIRFKGQDLAGVPTHRRAGLGIALVPQEREIFPSLTVHENMCVSMRHGSDWTIERVYDLFPRLRERWKNYGDQLSGGEQQMLAIGRALAGNPSLLLLDDPFEGLAPVIVDMLVDALSRIRTESAIAIILVEHKVDLALDLAEEALVLERGQIAWVGTCDHLLNDRERLAALIGLQDVGGVSRANG